MDAFSRLEDSALPIDVRQDSDQDSLKATSKQSNILFWIILGCFSLCVLLLWNCHVPGLDLPLLFSVCSLSAPCYFQLQAPAFLSTRSVLTTHICGSITHHHLYINHGFTSTLRQFNVVIIVHISRPSEFFSIVSLESHSVINSVFSVCFLDPVHNPCLLKSCQSSIPPGFSATAALPCLFSDLI